MEKTIKNIVFDFGGVLVGWDADALYLPYFGNDPQAMARFYEETHLKNWNREFDRGLPFDPTLTQLAEAFPHYAEPLRMFKTHWHNMLLGPITGTVEIFYALKKAGYRLFGLTNWSAETFPFAYYSYDFLRTFEDIVVSGREKLIKPDPAIYRLCLERNHLMPQESLFIDDNEENVIAARQVGMHAIPFQSPQRLLKDLQALGVRW